MPATKMVDVWEAAVAGYQAVERPYVVSGPNWTLTCPEHPKEVVVVIWATSGFWVPATAVEATPGGSLKVPPPQAVVATANNKVAARRHGCSKVRKFMVCSSP